MGVFVPSAAGRFQSAGFPGHGMQGADCTASRGRGSRDGGSLRLCDSGHAIVVDRSVGPLRRSHASVRGNHYLPTGLASNQGVLAALLLSAACQRAGPVL